MDGHHAAGTNPLCWAMSMAAERGQGNCGNLLPTASVAVKVPLVTEALALLIDRVGGVVEGVAGGDHLRDGRNKGPSYTSLDRARRREVSPRNVEAECRELAAAPVDDLVDRPRAELRLDRPLRHLPARRADDEGHLGCGHRVGSLIRQHTTALVAEVGPLPPVVRVDAFRDAAIRTVAHSK